MRHRRRGRKLGRNPKHQRALLRNLATSLILTEQDAEGEAGAPRVKGRIVTTLPKAKEVRPLVEKCVSIACQSLAAQEEAQQYETTHARNSERWRAWRQSDRWQKWSQAMAPAIAARRRVLRLIGSRQAVQVLFDDLAPRFADRPGGYTRIMRLAQPRLGDGGTRAILEFVGVRDRVPERSERPVFEAPEKETPGGEAPQAEPPEDRPADIGGQAPQQEADNEATSDPSSESPSS